MKFKSYPKYKESGIQWIGLIPKKWKIIPVRGVCKLGRGRVISNQEIEENQGKYPVFSSQTSNNGEMGKIDTYDFDGEYVTWTTDGANAGTTFYRNGKFNCTNVCGTLKRKNNKIHMKLLPYILNRISEYHVRYDINPKLMNDMMARIKIPLPMLNNQIIISKFLDKKTAEIDEFIGKDKKLIELLKEKRTALINHAVTKGLPVRRTQTGLDQNVKMKDSGIEWIGEIPEDWEILRLRYLLKNGIEGIKIGPFGSMLKSDEITNNGYKVYGQENVINRNFNKGSRYINEDKFKQLIGYQIHPGDLIITMMGTIGKAQIIPTIIDEGIMDSHLIRLRFNGKVETKFIEILINSSNYIKGEIKYFSKGSIMEGLNSGIIKDLLLCIPQKIEQTKIIQFVNRKVTKIDKTIQKIEEKINFLEEYKKSLIHHTVTGKIDVRGSGI